jgi:hypothetical protein
MAGWDDVREVALSLPETDERVARRLRQCYVREKLFVWSALCGERSRGPRRGSSRTTDLGRPRRALVAKEALLKTDGDVFFSTPHFDRYPAVLVRLDRITLEVLREVVVEAWLARAPRRLAEGLGRQGVVPPG